MTTVVRALVDHAFTEGTSTGNAARGRAGRWPPARRRYLRAFGERVGGEIEHLLTWNGVGTQAIQKRHHMMYNGVMGRTQIYLGEDELALLDRASRETGASRSELIRRAVRGTFGGGGKDQKLQALRASAGSWSDRPSGSEYVDAIRGGDLNERLARLGVK